MERIPGSETRISKGPEVETAGGQLWGREQKLGSSHIRVDREHGFCPQEPWEAPGSMGRE